MDNLIELFGKLNLDEIKVIEEIEDMNGLEKKFKTLNIHDEIEDLISDFKNIEIKEQSITNQQNIIINTHSGRKIYISFAGCHIDFIKDNKLESNLCGIAY